MTHAEWRQWRRCGRKVRHEALADAAVLSHWRTGAWAWRYQCECGGWHVTTDETTRTEAA